MAFILHGIFSPDTIFLKFIFLSELLYNLDT